MFSYGDSREGEHLIRYFLALPWFTLTLNITNDWTQLCFVNKLFCLSVFTTVNSNNWRFCNLKFCWTYESRNFTNSFEDSFCVGFQWNIIPTMNEPILYFSSKFPIRALTCIEHMELLFRKLLISQNVP